MTDQPYTDDDLLHEAGRQHGGLTDDPEFMTVGEVMEDETIPSTGQTWADLDHAAYNEAQRKIHDLIGDAADLGHWAVALGADELEPSADGITVDGDGKPAVRIHLAFAAGMSSKARTAFALGLAQALADGI